MALVRVPFYFINFLPTSLFDISILLLRARKSVVESEAFSLFLLRKHFITEIFLKKKSGDVKDEANYSFYILLHKRAKPILSPYPLPLSIYPPILSNSQSHIPPYLLPHSPRELKPYTPPYLLPLPTYPPIPHTPPTERELKTYTPPSYPSLRPPTHPQI